MSNVTMDNGNHRQVLPDLRLSVHRLEGIDEPNINEAHDDILEACLLVEYVSQQKDTSR